MSAWKTVALAELAESVDYGVTASATHRPLGPKFLRITDIQDGMVNWDSVPWCECDGRGATDAQLAPGDIVFARTGATTGKSFFVRECPADAVFASYLIRVRVGASADATYVSHFFQTPEYWAQIASNARGVAQPGVNATVLKALKIPLPPLSEQRRIAEVLDRAEALRTKRRGALAQLDALTQAIFLDMFGDPITNPKRWREASLGDVAELIAGSTLPEGVRFEGQEGGYFLLKVSDMNLPGNETYIERANLWSDRGGASGCTCPSASVVIPKRGGAIGTNKKRLSTRQCVLDPNLMAIWPHPDKLHIRYLFEWFRNLNLATLVSGSSVPQLNKQDLSPLKISVPTLATQHNFAERVGAVETVRATLRKSLNELDALFASLQHRAFRGEL